MYRLFVALELPESVRSRLALLQGGVPGARWVESSNLHLTLCFIGEVTGGSAADIDEALSHVVSPAMTLSLTGCGVFGGRDPHSLWVGVRAEPLLHQLHGRVEGALQRLGVELQHRKFSPHVTLARLKDPHRDKLGGFVAHHNLFDSGPFDITRFALFSSHLHTQGASYRVERTYPLQDD